LLSLVALVMLLASLFSIETAEVWCRVAVGATIDTDDDDGPYFACRQTASVPQRELTTHAGHAVLGSAEHTVLSAASQDSFIVDEPTFSLPQHWLPVVPDLCTRIIVAWGAVVYLTEASILPVGSVLLPGPLSRGPPVF